jgi:hypothetical protein
MKLRDGFYSINGLNLKYPVTVNSPVYFAVHVLTSPAHIRGTKASKDYIYELKEEISAKRALGNQIIWMLDPMVSDSKYKNYKIFGKPNQEAIKEYEGLVEIEIKKQLEMIDSRIELGGCDNFMITGYRNPNLIIREAYNNMDLDAEIARIKPVHATVAGEILFEDYPLAQNGRGCVNQVSGAVKVNKIPFELGKTLTSEHAE